MRVRHQFPADETNVFTLPKCSVQSEPWVIGAVGSKELAKSVPKIHILYLLRTVPYSSNRINCTESHCAVDHWFNAELDGLIFPSVWISVILPLLTYWTFHFFDVHLWKLSSVTLCFEREKDWPCISPPRRNLQESAGSSEHMMQPVCSTETPLQALLRSQQYRDPACGGGCSAERWLNLSYRYAFTL